MIRLNAYLGLGNQMFEYAFARALSEEYGGEEIALNPYFGALVNLTTPHGSIKPDLRLKNLCLNENVKVLTAVKGIPLAVVDFFEYSFYRFIVNVTSKKFNKLSKKGKYIHPGYIQFTYLTHEKTSRRHKSIKGYFGSEKFFSKIKPIIMEEMTAKIEPSTENRKMIKEMENCNSVCVHIRRGDYKVNQQYSQYLDICTETYYCRGMDYIASHTENPVFYIFSNTHEDLEWIKSNYHFKYPVKYVDLSNPDYEELRLMYSCKHFIISNSTFSWWGSYLSKNRDKIVVVPDRWLGTHNDEKFRNQTYEDVYRDDMIKIPVDLEEN